MGQKVYTTDSGDTWDLISYKVYGNSNQIEELYSANPKLLRVVIFEAGVDIICPDILATSGGDLPQWAK